MAEHIRKAALFLFTQECMKEYFDEFNFLHGTFVLITLQFYRELFYKLFSKRDVFIPESRTVPRI